MKKLFFLCCMLGLLFVGPRSLSAAPAVVTFASELGSPFQLIFDGQPFTRPGARAVRIDRLSPGFHWAEFLIPTGYGRGTTYRTRVFLDPGYETSYVLLVRPGFAPTLRKVGVVPLRRGGPTYGSAYPPAGPGAASYPENGGYMPPVSGPAYPSTPPNTPGNAGYYAEFTSAEVDGLLTAVRNLPFISDKLALAKDALSQAAIRTNDLCRILLAFSFDKDRLELAKYASTRVVDSQNFYRVYETLTFSASVRELQQFREQQARP